MQNVSKSHLTNIQHLSYPSVDLLILIGDHLVCLIVLKVKANSCYSKFFCVYVYNADGRR